jgi:hypothetical protein
MKIQMIRRFIFSALFLPLLGGAATFNATNDLGSPLALAFYATNATGQVSGFGSLTNAATNAVVSLVNTNPWAGVAVVNTQIGAARLNLFTALANTNGANASYLVTNGTLAWFSLGLAGTPNGAITNGSSGTNNPGGPVALPVQNYAGTYAPNGLFTAGYGSLYNQFDSTGTNFIAQYIKTTSTGNTGWVNNTNISGGGGGGGGGGGTTYTAGAGIIISGSVISSDTNVVATRASAISAAGLDRGFAFNGGTVGFLTGTDGTVLPTITLGDPNALAYAGAAGVTTQPNLNDLTGFYQTLKNSGAFNNLAFAFTANTNYNPWFTNSLVGPNATISGAVAYDFGGASFQNGGAILASNLTIPSTNFTFVVTWIDFRPPAPLTSIGSEWMAGLASSDGSNLANAFRTQFNAPASPLPWTGFGTGSNNATYSPYQGMFTLNQWNGATTYNIESQGSTAGEREVAVVTMSNNVLTAYYNDAPAKLYPSSAFSQGASPAIANTNLSILSIGKCLFSAYSLPSLPDTFVQNVLIFTNISLTANQQDSIFQALRYFEPGNVNDCGLGNSRLADNYASYPSNGIYFQAYNSPSHKRDTTWHNYAIGGTLISQWITYWTNVYAYVIYPYRPAAAGGCGKVTKFNLTLMDGINDFYNQSGDPSVNTTIATTLANYRMFVTSYLPPWVTKIAIEDYKVAANCTYYAPPSQVNSNLEYFNKTLFEQRSQSGQNLFSGVVRADSLVSYTTMNTNNSYSDQGGTAGLHLGGVNGWVVNQVLANALLAIHDGYGSDSQAAINAQFFTTNFFATPTWANWGYWGQ